MVIITGILKWVLIVCVSATTLAIIVTGTIKVFNDVALYFIDKITEQNKTYFQIYKYLKVRKAFRKWVNDNKAKGTDVMNSTLKDWQLTPNEQGLAKAKDSIPSASNKSYIVNNQLNRITKDETKVKQQYKR